MAHVDRRTLGITLVWFVIINLFALVSLNRVAVKDDSAYAWIDPATVEQVQSWNPIPLHAKWDSFWLLSVANEGYQYAPNVLSNVVFFPLYPLLVKIVSFVTTGNVILAGWIVSTLALFGAAWLLAKLVREFHPDVSPSETVMLLLLFPAAFFLNAVYTESLFLFLSLGTFLFARRGKFWVAGIFGFFAALTRITGILLVIPLLVEFIRQRHQQTIPPLSKGRLGGVVLVLLGPITFFSYHLKTFGDFFLFFRVQETWGRAFALNTDHFLLFNAASTANFVIDLCYVLFALVGGILAIRRLGASYGFYTLAVAGSALASGTTMSIGRYVLMAFPLFMLGASIRNETGRFAWRILSTLLLAITTLLFVSNGWAG
ncbi:MAG: hypothetical protein HY341_03110 [Candidatus Kerfeldbacteria bacterium]|nr:hypothetical protein [Candidatus Kerfeldbacteria bacterium]